MINNRQNGRRRGRGGQRVGGGNPGRPESGNRIDNRARGNASQLHEKYKTLAADAQRQGDRVNTEYYLQFADHYFRVLAESRPRADEQAQRRGNDSFDDEFDGDGEEYGQEGEAGQPDQYQPRGDRNDGRSDGRHDGRQDGRSDDRPRQDGRQAPDTRQDGRQQDDRPRYQPRQDRQSQAQSQAQGQDDRSRRDGAQDQRLRDDRPARADTRADNATVATSDDVNQAPVVADDQLTPPERATQEASTPRAADVDAPAPRRRGRPPKVRTEEVRTDEEPAAEPMGLDADRLPPSLSVSASAEPDAGEPAEKPRRRRRLSAETAEAG